LFHLKKDDGLVEMRHYAIRAQPVGINRNIKKILQSKIPDLSQLRDVSEFLDSQAYGAGAASDSEAEEEYSKVVLPDKFKGTGNERSQKSAIKLTELGPRLTLELFKVESGLCEGDILFHKFQAKTPEEARQTKERVSRNYAIISDIHSHIFNCFMYACAQIERQKQLKIQRKAIQDANVKRKREELEAKRAAKQEKKRLRLESGGAAGTGASDEEGDSADDDSEEEEEQSEGDGDGELDDDDDVEYGSEDEEY
jgi:ribosome biogenesis protein SSF1/2